MTTKLPVEPLTQQDILLILSRQTDAGNALVTAGLVEDELEKLLLTAGRELTNKHAKEIFGAMGPLHGFSAKIEIAYMFEFIDKSVRDDLQIIKSIRNKFAHTTRFVFFESPHIDQECRRLSNWKEDAPNEELFRTRAIECINAVKSKINELMFVKALKEPLTVVDDE
jgi:DNA-binding MltR family transcriptional regulator